MFCLWLATLFEQAPPPAQPEPYSLGRATPEGAKLTVKRLMDSVSAKDDRAFDQIGRGMIFMLAPDFGVPVSRDKLEQALSHCSSPQVVTSKAEDEPKVQAVRINMQCQLNEGRPPVDVVADVFADDQHAFAFIIGGIDKLWPRKAKNP